MKITKFIHSCLLLENDTSKILFDPGKFSFAEGLVKPGQFRGLNSIILTHFHPDHIDIDALETIIANNPDVEVMANSEIHHKLAEEDIQSRVFERGTIQIDDFKLEAIDAPHEKLLADTIPQNTAYLVNNAFLHPGDSLSQNLLVHKGIKLLGLPIMAPWTTELKVYEFAVRMAPQTVLPIHDGFAKDFFLKSRYENLENFLKRENIQFTHAGKAGDSISI